MIRHGSAGRKWFRAAANIQGYWFPKEDLDTESFAFDLLHNANAEDQRLPRKIAADAWFDNRAAVNLALTCGSIIAKSLASCSTRSEFSVRMYCRFSSAESSCDM
jgi:hypothetical protein